MSFNPVYGYISLLGEQSLNCFSCFVGDNRVILSRDVIFQEKPSRCVQLMLKEPSNEEKHAEEKLDEKEQEPTSDAEDDSEEKEQELKKAMNSFNPQMTDN
ncbi:hypothetical protein AVEN_262185-1 [Araneus ventricosus]|uniref:Uncharacterized protein n=1 Tax=Araneus ventricosus TaxID=182803 RepID=A0A4Y2HJK9_ARAVE|nr:hypothetical protein AVEN_262185-1 [Araneus ventricosus]